MEEIGSFRGAVFKKKGCGAKNSLGNIATKRRKGFLDLWTKVKIC